MQKSKLKRFFAINENERSINLKIQCKIPRRQKVTFTENFRCFKHMEILLWNSPMEHLQVFRSIPIILEFWSKVGGDVHCSRYTTSDPGPPPT